MERCAGDRVAFGVAWQRHAEDSLATAPLGLVEVGIAWRKCLIPRAANRSQQLERALGGVADVLLDQGGREIRIACERRHHDFAVFLEFPPAQSLR